MGLSKKTFFYSMVLASIMTAFIILYFALMLPSLYVEYVKESNLQSVVEVQKQYLEKRNYEELTVRNPFNTVTVEIPMEGNEIYLTGKYFRLKAEVLDQDMQGLLQETKRLLKRGGQESEGEEWEELAAIWQEKGAAFLSGVMEKISMLSQEIPIEIALESNTEGGAFTEEYTQIYAYSAGVVVYEAGVSDGSNSYTNYVALGVEDEGIVITLMSTVTPQMEEIKPVVFGSLPMICMVVFLLVLIASHFFSGKIVTPIIRLANHALSAQHDGDMEPEPFPDSGKDEVAALGNALNQLYEKLRESNRELSNKNALLEEENERQEVFLRASSHQLKTPIAAALLLIEGMMDQVGKYKDVDAYLPEVKEQLKAMRKIVEDILDLNHHAIHLEKEEVSLEELVKEEAAAYRVQMESKKQSLSVSGEKHMITDREILKIIIDNLISNAVVYSPHGARIEIEITKEGLFVTNYGVRIQEEILLDVYSPFVSSDTKHKGKGLGLYIVAYYGRLLGMESTIENLDNGVKSSLFFDTFRHTAFEGRNIPNG
ncbi:MAG: HAMP domain-containing histidine kinase [Lachnospiraceae bacterium]|nr:HAMP domain-containing histidine kinase [Lachnospiraceae bacterium]